MATITTLAILNNSLVLCGASPVTSITEETPNARALNAAYDISRKEILTECRWSFSTTRSTLVTVATTAIAWFHNGEAYAYTKPSNCLRIWEMSDSQAIWREEAYYIISDTAGLGVKYTFDQDEVGLYPPYFVTAFIDRLCADISFMILNSPKRSEDFLLKYKKFSLPNAMSANSQTGTQQTVIDDYWESAKLSNGGNPARSYS